jgi:lysozyme family protein
MARVQCGTSVRYGAYPQGSGGCLLRFLDAPTRVLLLTAGHVVLPTSAQQGDPIENLSLPGQAFGKLRTWTTLAGDTTVDAALIWVDPALVDPGVLGLGAVTGINTQPVKGQALRLVTRDGGPVRETEIDQLGYDIQLSAAGPDWPLAQLYRNQILCNPPISLDGDSGAVMLDTDNRVVGMLVGGAEGVGDLVTPIAAILNHPDWKGQLELVTAIGTDAVSPFAATVTPPLIETQGTAPAAAKAPAKQPVPRPTTTTFDALKPYYEALFADCTIRPQYVDQIDLARRLVVKNREAYQAVSDKTEAPWWYIGIVHGLECNYSFTHHLHNGDPLGARTVQVPQGRPKIWNPPNDWTSSAVDAIEGEGYANQADWSLAATLFRLEGYNGYGYYARGINSPYLWSFSNQYEKGKYVADHLYDPNAISKQCGAAVILKALIAHGDIDAPAGGSPG